jgi:hypothetical protein
MNRHSEIPLAAVLMTCSPLPSSPHWFILFTPLPSPLTFCVGNQNHSQNYTEGVRNGFLNLPSPATVSFFQPELFSFKLRRGPTAITGTDDALALRTPRRGGPYGGVETCIPL